MYAPIKSIFQDNTQRHIFCWNIKLKTKKNVTIIIDHISYIFVNKYVNVIIPLFYAYINLRFQRNTPTQIYFEEISK